MRPVPCLALCLVGFVLTGCAARTDRPDSDVARIVEREEARRAASTAVALADVEPVELASAAVALETLGILYVPNARELVATDAPAREPAVAGWVEGTPPSWGATYVVTLAPQLDEPMDAGVEASSDDADAGDDDSRPGRRRGNGQQRPKVRLQILNLKVNELPLSFSGSVKNMNSVQFRVTLRM